MRRNVQAGSSSTLEAACVRPCRRSLGQHEQACFCLAWLSGHSPEDPPECPRDCGADLVALSHPSPRCSSSRVRIHDLRTDKLALSLSAHQLGVSAVQMDDWKVVSGGEEGLVSVWDYRMNRKLWELHSR